MRIGSIPAMQNKFSKLAPYFFLILVSVFGMENGMQYNVHNGLILQLVGITLSDSDVAYNAHNHHN